MTITHRIVYFSPAGTTRQVAEAIGGFLRARGQSVSLLDLARRQNPAASFVSDAQPFCLWLGSPVYCDHAVPLVEDFVRSLPPTSGFAVPFVTWGAVTSGLALPEMAACLTEQGFAVLGAAKVMAEHSSLWQSSQPLAAGRPNAGDLNRIEALVESVLTKIARGRTEILPAERLDYLPPALKAQSAAKSLAGIKAMQPPRAADKNICTRCGECVQICPVEAIRLDPFPVIDDSCILCQQCTRHCPVGAYPYDGPAVETRIQTMAKESAEAKETGIFV